MLSPGYVIAVAIMNTAAMATYRNYGCTCMHTRAHMCTHLRHGCKRESIWGKRKSSVGMGKREDNYKINK